MVSLTKHATRLRRIPQSGVRRSIVQDPCGQKFCDNNHALSFLNTLSVQGLKNLHQVLGDIFFVLFALFLRHVPLPDDLETFAFLLEHVEDTILCP